MFNEITFNSLSTTSSKIRYLSSIGMSRGDIARKLEIRYQHVRNVLLQTNKKGESKAPIDAMISSDIM